MPILLGDDEGLDTFEMRLLEKTLITENTENKYYY